MSEAWNKQRQTPLGSGMEATRVRQTLETVEGS